MCMHSLQNPLAVSIVKVVAVNDKSIYKAVSYGKKRVSFDFLNCSLKELRVMYKFIQKINNEVMENGEKKYSI